MKKKALTATPSCQCRLALRQADNAAIQHTGDHIGRREWWCEGPSVVDALRKLSVRLWKGNGVTYCRGLGVMSGATARSFSAGLTVLTDNYVCTDLLNGCRPLGQAHVAWFINLLFPPSVSGLVLFCALPCIFICTGALWYNKRFGSTLNHLIYRRSGFVISEFTCMHVYIHQLWHTTRNYYFIAEY